MIDSPAENKAVAPDRRKTKWGDNGPHHRIQYGCTACGNYFPTKDEADACRESHRAKEAADLAATEKKMLEGKRITESTP